MRCCKLKLPAASAQVVRLDDAGMSVQMAEYVCHAVIRHFREFDGYEADVRAGQVVVSQAAQPRRLSRRRAGSGRAGRAGGAGAARVRVSGARLEPQPQDARRRGLPQRAGPASTASCGQCRVLVNLLPLTPDTRDILNRDTLSLLQARWLPHQRGARRPPGRGRPDRAAGQRPPGGRHAGRVPHRAAARRATRSGNTPRSRVTPHTSARTLRAESIAQIVGKIAALERGEPVAGVVDPGTWLLKPLRTTR